MARKSSGSDDWWAIIFVVFIIVVCFPIGVVSHSRSFWSGRSIGYWLTWVALIASIIGVSVLIANS